MENQRKHTIVVHKPKGKAHDVPEHKSKAAQVPLTLLQLQNQIKRDPAAYVEEFRQQYLHFQSTLEIFKLKPTDEYKSFGELVSFLSAITPCYPKELATLPSQIYDLLKHHGAVLHPELRQTLCKSLILLRNRDFYDVTSLLELFFELFRLPDKRLRELLYSHIVNDIKRVNLHKKNNAVNKTLQNFMFTMLKDSNPIAAKQSLDVMVELYKKKIWDDERTVNVIATACFSPVTKILVAALKFFLGKDEEDLESDDDSDDEGVDHRAKYLNLVMNKGHVKKTKKRAHRIERALRAMHKQDKKEKDPSALYNSAALNMLHDPQTMAEKLFSQLSSRNEKFEVKLLMMNLISRLVGVHHLMLLNFYPFLQRYTQPHQLEVTSILTYLAQASHELVPGDVLEPLLVAIANSFVTERASSEAIAVGINAIREICARCPLAMNEDLLSDLVQYKSYRDKGVTTAARSLIQLFRDVNPTMLHKKEKGRPGMAHDPSTQVLQYGENRSSDFVPGAELLSLYQEQHPDVEEQDNDGWETASDESDDSDDGEWQNVSHSDDDDEQAEGEDAPELADPLTEQERKQRAIALSSQKVFTPADFAKIEELREQHAMNSALGLKRKHDERPDILSKSAILPSGKKARQNKEERLASVHAGREDRGKFGSVKSRMNEFASTTNKEKLKRKNPVMIQHTHRVQVKKKMSVHDRQKRKRQSIKRDSRNRR